MSPMKNAVTKIRPANMARRALRLRLCIQRVSRARNLPSDAQLRRFARAALADVVGQCELTLRIVDTTEGAALNAAYRHKSGPTNVLSFPFQPLPGQVSKSLGDIVICAPVVTREALAQGKPLLAHWAHLVVHGVLHLRGFDHMSAVDAERMEALETAILGRLGYADPYAVGC